MTDFRKSFDDMAELIAVKATHKDATFAEITEAFKVMTAYYALLLKHKGKPDSVSDGFDFANGIEDEHGSTGVPGRRNS